MARTLCVLGVAVQVVISGMMAISAFIPGIYSPYSLSVVIPAVFLLFRLNVSKPSPGNCAQSSIVLFAWLRWVAFPWLGETA